MSDKYDKIRFIGYAVPTTPANMDYISMTDGPAWLTGTYLANPDTQADINGRIQIMKNAVDMAKAKLPANETGVVNVFLGPEFYFHGIQGPYVFAEDGDDPIYYLTQELEKVFNTTDYPNWTFVFGSIVTTQIKNEKYLLQSNGAVLRNSIVKGLYEAYSKSYGPLQDIISDMISDFIRSCHSFPCCVVRNRSVVIGNISLSPIPIDAKQDTAKRVNKMTVEKYFVSSIDFLIYDAISTASITEQMTAYAPIDISNGDLKQGQYDPYAIFRQEQVDHLNAIDGARGMNYGVEICLDHSDMRLRQNINNEPSNHGGVHVQLIPSCGMEILSRSIACNANGFVFNCDGEFTIGTANSGAENINGVECLYASYQYSENNNYGAHTQLARVKTPATGINPIAVSNAVCQKFDEVDITVLPVDAPSYFSSFFAGGGGEVHIYGLNNPYTIYP